MCEIWNSQTYIYVINHPLSQVEIVVRWIQDYVYGYGSELNSVLWHWPTWLYSQIRHLKHKWLQRSFTVVRKRRQTTACHSLPRPSSSVFSTASTTGSGLKIWGTYHCHLNQHFESDGTDNLKQGTLWRSIHDDCWCATQGMRNKSKESTNILTIIRTSGCWYNTTMSGAFTPAPKSCLYIGKRQPSTNYWFCVQELWLQEFILQLWCSLVF